MLQEPVSLLPSVTEKVNQSYVSSSSDDDSSVAPPGHAPGFPSQSPLEASTALHLKNKQHKRTTALDHDTITHTAGTNIPAVAPVPSNEKESTNISPQVQPNTTKTEEVDISQVLTPARDNTVKDIPIRDGNSTTNDSAHENKDDDLREKIKLLEEQLSLLTLTIQSLQIQQNQNLARPETPDKIEDGSPTHIFDSPIMERDSLTVNSMLELESPALCDRKEAEFDESQIAPAPDLEYRSYTPNYEEELRNIRKTSRGMSLDNTNTASCASTVVAGCTISSDVSDHQLDHKDYNEEEKKEEVIVHPPNHVNANKGNATKKELKTKGGEKAQHTKTTLEKELNPIQRDIIAECKEKDGGKTIGTKTISKPPKAPLPPITPDKNNSRGNFSVTPSKGESVTVPKQLIEEAKNRNAVVDFIRGLNIDSKQPDGSASEDVDANMEEFLTVPFRIENLMFFGIAICLDSFLSVLTVTPIKFVWSCLCLVSSITRPGKGVGHCRFHRRHLYQMLRVLVIVLTYKCALCPISLGRLYHWIRGQAMLKLYVLLAMVVSFADGKTCTIIA